MNTGFVRPAIAIVLTACGIETKRSKRSPDGMLTIAIVLTACGIETALTYASNARARFTLQ